VGECVPRPRPHGGEDARLTRAGLARLRLLLILGALSAFGPLSIDLYLPALPKLTSDFGAQAWQGQLTLTSCILGLAVGQLAFGPLTDRLGRRTPVVAGLAAYAVASLACAAAGSIGVLVALRFVQGLAGGAGIVVGRSVVRDIASGATAARLFSILMVVIGVVPVVAPVAGGQLLRLTSWRGLFVILTAIDVVILVATLLWLKETLPSERRRSGWDTGLGELLHDRLFVAYSLVLSLGFASMFSYIAGSSFVLQDIYGMSPQLYGVVFGINACGIIVSSQLGRLVVERTGARRLLVVGVGAQAVSGTTLLAIVLGGGIGLAGVLPCLFVTVSSIGLVIPNATALAMTDYPHAAGSASALIGGSQFLLGGLAAPLVGVAGRDTAVPMALLMVGFGVAGLAAAAIARSVASQSVALPASQAAPR
jgi:DHA1 family bicyclomycin/chloramphenicol resistance-like MFS transporter